MVASNYLNKGRQASDLPKIDELQIDIIMNPKFISIARGSGRILESCSVRYSKLVFEIPITI